VIKILIPLVLFTFVEAQENLIIEPNNYEFEYFLTTPLSGFAISSLVQINVYIDNEDNVVLGGVQIEIDSLGKYAKQMSDYVFNCPPIDDSYRRHRRPVFSVFTEPHSHYETYIQVLDQLKLVGIKRISIADGKLASYNEDRYPEKNYKIKIEK